MKDRVIVACCMAPGCGHKELTAAAALGIVTKYCPTHGTILVGLAYERL